VTARYCGRDFTDAEMELIENLIGEHPTREAIARAMCDKLNWNKPDGLPKTMSAKVALLRMHRDGLIVLPAPKHEGHNVRRPLAATFASDPKDQLDCSRGISRIFACEGFRQGLILVSGMNLSGATTISATCP
jgi:hypothetical protein